ncbi:MAG: class I SAM-dependent methyltransferase [Cytophagales bacterium]|nr:class I SAM-dependent methyltransferase [Cytophagales bacterium]
MDEIKEAAWPKQYKSILAKSKEIGFDMPSDLYIGSLLKTLVSSKPGGRFLELGSGIGLSLSWMVDGMSADARLITIDNDPKLSEIVKSFFNEDGRVEILCQDGAEFIRNYKGELFDLVFADAWPGKYSELDEVLAFIKPGGFYIIDDMIEQENWPEGHAAKAENLLAKLENRGDLVLTKMDWSTGIMVCVKQ